MQKLIFVIVFFIGLNACCNQQNTVKSLVKTGAERTESYVYLLKNKKIALAVNHTSLIGSTHLTDTLMSLGVDISVIFSPEHGLKGIEDAGMEINNIPDSRNTIKIISLYGKKKKPDPDDLHDIDLVVFDMQDVGVRFYTYISTLHYIMEACAENNVALLLLDRPNPNGHYIDGPVMEEKYKSFIGMHPIPLVYGLTIGELAQMINGERWLANEKKCNLQVIPCENYSHNVLYVLPVNPSPNLKSMEAIYFYPSLGLFEGTVMSVGRGTDSPFRVVGHPDYPDKSFSFIPQSMPGATKPKYHNLKCYGINFKNIPTEQIRARKTIDLSYLIKIYQTMPDKENFFTDYFNNLAGNPKLKEQIKDGLSEEEIRESWQQDLDKYLNNRKKYLIYE